MEDGILTKVTLDIFSSTPNNFSHIVEVSYEAIYFWSSCSKAQSDEPMNLGLYLLHLRMLRFNCLDVLYINPHIISIGEFTTVPHNTSFCYYKTKTDLSIFTINHKDYQHHVVLYISFILNNITYFALSPNQKKSLKFESQISTLSKSLIAQFKKNGVKLNNNKRVKIIVEQLEAG